MTGSQFAEKFKLKNAQIQNNTNASLNKMMHDHLKEEEMRRSMVSIGNNSGSNSIKVSNKLLS